MSEHYFSKNQSTKFNPTLIKDQIFKKDIEFYTASGVFSIGHIDFGSKVLIEHAIIEDGWSVLDLACGWGPVGISLMKEYKDLNLFFTDVNERSVKLTVMNLKLHKKEAKVKSGNLYEKVEGKFNTILVNPPQTAGKQVCIEMIDQSVNYLLPGGCLQLVARHQKGGKSFAKRMEEVFGNVKDICKKGGFRVYVSYLES